MPIEAMALALALVRSAFEVAHPLRYSPQATSIIDTCKLDVASSRVNLMGRIKCHVACSM